MKPCVCKTKQPSRRSTLSTLNSPTHSLPENDSPSVLTCCSAKSDNAPSLSSNRILRGISKCTSDNSRITASGKGIRYATPFFLLPLLDVLRDRYPAGTRTKGQDRAKPSQNN